MNAFYLGAAFRFAEGRAIAAGSQSPASSGMAFYAIPATHARAALEAWLAEMSHIDLEPVLIHGFGRFEGYDPDHAMFEMEPGEPEAMAQQAMTDGKIVVSESYMVELPSAAPKQVYFGCIERGNPPALWEVAVRHASLPEAARVLVASEGVEGLHGLSDAMLADDAAVFDGKPLDLVALQMAGRDLGEWETGGRFDG